MATFEDPGRNPAQEVGGGLNGKEGGVCINLMLRWKDLGSIRFCSPFSSKLVVYGHCLVTLPTQFMKH